MLWTASPILFCAAVIGIWKYGGYAMSGVEMAHECKPERDENTQFRHDQQVLNAEMLQKLKGIDGNLKILLGDRYVSNPGG